MLLISEILKYESCRSLSHWLKTLGRTIHTILVCRHLYSNQSIESKKHFTKFWLIYPKWIGLLSETNKHLWILLLASDLLWCILVCTGMYRCVTACLDALVKLYYCHKYPHKTDKLGQLGYCLVYGALASTTDNKVYSQSIRLPLGFSKCHLLV